MHARCLGAASTVAPLGLLPARDDDPLHAWAAWPFQHQLKAVRLPNLLPSQRYRSSELAQMAGAAGAPALNGAARLPFLNWKWRPRPHFRQHLVLTRSHSAALSPA